MPERIFQVKAYKNSCRVRRKAGLQIFRKPWTASRDIIKEQHCDPLSRCLIIEANVSEELMDLGNSLHNMMDNTEEDNQNSKIGIKKLVTLKYHNLSRSQAGSSLGENSKITEDDESIDDTQSTILSELYLYFSFSRSIRKQIQHHEQKDTMKYIRELQNRMSKRELQGNIYCNSKERNKELLSVLNKTTDLYSNKFSISKIRKRVRKQREEKKSQV